MIADISSPQKCFEKAEQLKKERKRLFECLFFVTREFQIKKIDKKQTLYPSILSRFFLALPGLSSCSRFTYQK
jgi:hypothetical protein